MSVHCEEVITDCSERKSSAPPQAAPWMGSGIDRKWVSKLSLKQLFCIVITVITLSTPMRTPARSKKLNIEPTSPPPPHPPHPLQCTPFHLGSINFRNRRRSFFKEPLISIATLHVVTPDCIDLLSLTELFPQVPFSVTIISNRCKEATINSFMKGCFSSLSSFQSTIFKNACFFISMRSKHEL